MHVAAALDPIGGLLGVAGVPGHRGRLRPPAGLAGRVRDRALVGIEGTGSYGAGLARHVTAAGIRVVEVDRSDRQDRRRQGKSDPLDAVSAARAAQSGRARGAPKGRDGAVEAIRALMVAKRSARSERTQTINQARALVLTGPDDLRTRFAGHTAAGLVSRAWRRCGPGPATSSATPPASRCASWDGAPSSSTASSSASTSSSSRSSTARAPGLLALYGVGPDTAALLLIAAGDHPERLRSRGRLGAPVRRRPDPGIVGESHPPPAQPRRRPPGQPRPVADRVHPDELPPADPRLRRAAHQGRKVQERDHPLPEALRRPRGLPPPPPAAG